MIPVRAWFVVFALLQLVATSVQALPISIRIFDHAGSSGKLKLTAGSQTCEIVFRGEEKYREACQFDLPPSVTSISLAGNYSWQGKKSQGTHSWQVVDMGPMFKPLREGNRPFGARVLDFLRAFAAFSKGQPVWAEENLVYFEQGERASAEAVAAAEKRLGFPLPAEYKSFLLEVGELSIDDSYTTAAADLKDGYQAMIKDWGTPQPDLDSELNDQVRKVLKESVLLYTEVGDGLGGFFYRPSGSTTCKGSAYYFMHQDDLSDPGLLKKLDGTCRNYSEAFLWLLATQAVQRFEEYRTTHALIDSSATGVFRMEMYNDSSGGKLAFTLDPIWGEIE